ncbi:MAG: SRPBCC domain-containing protein [Dehalococcoidia bacterium]|nr:SRPBCC domain-containing protein [Dehalococcoidia bacterium]
MSKAEKVFMVERPIEAVWGFLSDMVSVGSCMPGCEKVQVLSDTDSEWTVTVKVGPVSKTIQAKARTIETQPPYRAAFIVEANELYLEGSLDLRAVSPSRTEVVYRSMAKAKGPLEKLLGQIISSRLDGDAEAFAQNVRSRLAFDSAL